MRAEEKRPLWPRTRCYLVPPAAGFAREYHCTAKMVSPKVTSDLRATFHGRHVFTEVAARICDRFHDSRGDLFRPTLLVSSTYDTYDTYDTGRTRTVPASSRSTDAVVDDR